MVLWSDAPWWIFAILTRPIKLQFIVCYVQPKAWLASLVFTTLCFLFAQKKIEVMPKSLYCMRWLLPISVLWFMVCAILVPTYENQLFYILSIHSIFFLTLNTFTSWISGFYLSALYSKSRGSLLFNVLLALVFNVWGQYHFYKKLSQVSVTKSISIVDILYGFFLFISIAVSYLMSTGVGKTIW